MFSVDKGQKVNSKRAAKKHSLEHSPRQEQLEANLLAENYKQKSIKMKNDLMKKAILNKV